MGQSVRCVFLLFKLITFFTLSITYYNLKVIRNRSVKLSFKSVEFFWSFSQYIRIPRFNKTYKMYARIPRIGEILKHAKFKNFKTKFCYQVTKPRFEITNLNLTGSLFWSAERSKTCSKLEFMVRDF